MTDSLDVSEELFSELQLGETLVRSPHWVWCRGLEAIATLNGPTWQGRGRVLVDRFDEKTGRVFVVEKRDFLQGRGSWFIVEDAVPIVRLATTKGWLLHLVRTAWGLEGLGVFMRNGVWVVGTPDVLLGTGQEEHVALVNALLGASATNVEVQDT